MPRLDDIDASLRAPLEALRATLRTVFGDRLRALVLYGEHAPAAAREGGGREPSATTSTGGAGVPALKLEPATTLALVETLTFDDLAACAAEMPGLGRRNLATPVILPIDEFHRSLDAFPLEYGAIIARHVVLAGEDPFAGLAVRPDDLRHACEVQAKSHVIHLREGYLESGGARTAVARLVAASAAAFAGLLTNLARLEGLEQIQVDGDRLASHAEATFGISAALVRRILELRGLDRPPDAAADLYREYLAAAEQLSHFADRWRSTK